jgi:hypothetical protein
MEYIKQKLRLELRIETIKELKFASNGNGLEEISKENRDDFVTALYAALEYSKTMKEAEDVKYLKGIIKALGDLKQISKWKQNPQLLAQTCDNLHTFIHENYKQDETPASIIRLRALTGLIVQAVNFLVGITLSAAFTFFTVLLIPYIPVVHILAAASGLILTYLAAVFIDSLLGFDDSDSLWKLLIHGKREKDRINDTLLEKCGLFAPKPIFESPFTPLISSTPSVLDTLEPVYLKTQNTMYG